MKKRRNLIQKANALSKVIKIMAINFFTKSMCYVYKKIVGINIFSLVKISLQVCNFCYLN